MCFKITKTNKRIEKIITKKIERLKKQFCNLSYEVIGHIDGQWSLEVVYTTPQEKIMDGHKSATFIIYEMKPIPNGNGFYLNLVDEQGVYIEVK